MEEPFSCTICDKGSSQINALRINVKNNTREKSPLVAHYVVKALVLKCGALQ